MRNVFLWLILSLLLASAFVYIEVLIMAVALSNSHYSLYFTLLGIAGLFSWLRALSSFHSVTSTPVWNAVFKAMSLLFFIALALGFLGLLGNVYFLILGKMS